jgi:hypothetical protein
MKKIIGLAALLAGTAGVFVLPAAAESWHNNNAYTAPAYTAPAYTATRNTGFYQNGYENGYDNGYNTRYERRDGHDRDRDRDARRDVRPVRYERGDRR